MKKYKIAVYILYIFFAISLTVFLFSIVYTPLKRNSLENIDLKFKDYTFLKMSLQKKEEQFTAHQLVEIANLKLEETRDRVKMEVESSYYKLERSQEQLDFAMSSLDNAAKNVSVMLDRYHEGLSSVLEVLDAQLYWQKTYFNYINAKYQLNVAYSEYLRAMGVISY